MRSVETYPQVQKLDVTPEMRARCEQWLLEEVEDARAARTQAEFLWREILRLYDGVPKNPVRNTPVEQAPNIEITLGAIATDSIYAQTIDLINNVSPLATSRVVGGNDRWVKHAKAIQNFSNYIADEECDIRNAMNHTLLDCPQLGTGVYYIPFREHTKKTDTHRVIWRAPQVISMPPEDFLTPGGAYDDLQTSRWTGMRFWFTRSELETMKQHRGWDLTRVTATAQKDWVRVRRESLARSYSNINRMANLYEIYIIHAFYDIDMDGIDEDLQIAWDRTSKSALNIRYTPYDMRPNEACRYQVRSHMFPGLGVMEMLRPYQEELTETHNHQLINVILSNCRMYKSRTGTVPEGTMAVWPNRNIELSNPEDLQEMVLSDIYPSLPQIQAMITSLAERRVGINDLTQPRPSAVLGSRTPGITALSMLQQVSKRFTPAFDEMRSATTRALRQCLWRYSERLRSNDPLIAPHIQRVLGEDQAKLVIELLSQEDFEQSVSVELTSSNAQVNREADKQNAMMLVNVLSQYYQKMLELVAMASNPQTPPPVRDTAVKIATAGSEIIDRTIRTFDQVRDSKTFLIDIQKEFADAEQFAQQQQIMGLVQQMAGAATGAPPEPGAQPGQEGQSASGMNGARPRRSPRPAPQM